MKAGLILFCISLFPFYNKVVSATETDPIVTKELIFKTFDAVSLSSSFDVSIKHGTKQKVLITGPEELIKKLDAHLDEKTLLLKMQKGRYKKLNLKVEVTIPRLRGAFLQGSGDIDIATFTNLSNLKLMVTGSGDINTVGKLIIKDKVDIKITGSGDISVKGTASHSNVALTGSGDCKTSNLKTTSNSSSILGSGNIEVNASQRIEVKILGSGDLYYSGNPSIEHKITGSGKVQKQH